MQVHQWVDGGIFALGLWLGHAIRHDIIQNLRWKTAAFNLHPDAIAPFFPEYFWLFLVVIPMTPLVLEWQGFYDRSLFARRGDWIWQLARACAICTGGLILIEFVLRREAARGVFALFGLCSFSLMAIKEDLVRRAYASALGQTLYRKRVLLVGAIEDTARLRADIARGMEQLEVVDEFDLNDTTIDTLVTCLHEKSINMVALSARHTFFGKVEKAIQACELEGVEAWLVADFFKTQISRTSLDEFYGRPVLVFHSGPDMAWARLVKQGIDFIGAAVLLLCWSIPMLIAAIAIKLGSRGPVLFKQERAGLNGQPFVMYKFRTMVTNAEQLKQELAVLNEMSGPVFKVTNDPRVTRVGRILRKYSIDEFPQLFNVLRFEMSLVGPRPLPVDEVKRFDDPAHRRRLSVKPGLTCLWQVGGRNNVKNFAEWVRLDLQYIDNWTIWLDFRILWKTIWVVLRGTGAS
ncbi:MAG TPA: sugar transferase [Verrucomicrobiae bacterium]|nr:sugar transferase [Verrucomicrobiae bacterium]